MNKELEQRIRDNLGANILIEYDNQNREIDYKQIKLMRASEIVLLDKKIESNKKNIAKEVEKKNKQLEIEQKDLEEKQKKYQEEQEFMNKYSLLKFIIVHNYSMLKGLVTDESFFEQDFSYLFKMERSIERSKAIKDLIESNNQFKIIYEAIGGE